MNWPIFIANRLSFSKIPTFSKTIFRLSITAIALSITIMLVSWALINGFKKEISEKIFGFWGHIHISDANINKALESIPIDKNQIFYPSIDTIQSIPYTAEPSFWEFNAAVIKYTQGGIRHIQTYVTMPGILKTKAAQEGIVIKGVGNDFDWNFLKKYIISGSTLADYKEDERPIILSKQTANRLSTDVGKKILLFVAIDKEVVKRVYKVIGIYKTGLEEYDKKIAIARQDEVQEMLGWDSTKVAGFEVFLDDIKDLPVFTDYLYYEKVPNNLYIENIRQKFNSIFDWLDYFDMNGFIIWVLMTFVAIICMITTLLIIILERTPMIGILKSLGSRNRPIRFIFLINAFHIISRGILIGNIIGLAFCWIQNKFHLVKLSEADYYISYAPISINWTQVLLLNLASIIIIILCLILPSYLVSRIVPVKSMKFR
ncbi:MAG: ABC transporter permease [Saprospiraceae bacterium]|nr:ABC transporter permease [Saprospiraceae bacterium]